MEVDHIGEKANKLTNWLSTATPEAITRFFEEAEEHGFCMNRNKLDLMDPEFWKKEISETPKKFIYKEPETGLFYETADIKEYLQDCRQRKRVLSTEDILDYEMIHKDRPQKLFFWISKRFEDDVGRFSAALKKFLLDKFTQDTDISIDEFEDRYIIVCSNIVVKNYEQKMALLKKFGNAHRTDEIGNYAIQPNPDLYEKIPSIANVAYKNPAVQQLINSDYELTGELTQKLLDLSICYFSKPANDMSGYIYLVQEREFYNSGERTYKIGKTRNGVRRLKAYPKGSKLFICIRVKNSDTSERQLLGSFQKQFQWRKEDYGDEYFTGDVNKMVDLIWKHRQFERW